MPCEKPDFLIREQWLSQPPASFQMQTTERGTLGRADSLMDGALHAIAQALGNSPCSSPSAHFLLLSLGTGLARAAEVLFSNMKLTA